MREACPEADIGKCRLLPIGSLTENLPLFNLRVTRSHGCTSIIETASRTRALGRKDGGTHTIRKSGEEGIDLEVCVPTPDLLTGEGTITSVMLAEGEFASTVHVGPPGQIMNAYRPLIRWASDRGYWPSGPVREVRLGSFGKADEPLEDITEILVPLEKVA